jgi:hypothetical protein
MFDVSDSLDISKENKDIKRKLGEKNFFLPRKSRRTEASKELSVSISCLADYKLFFFSYLLIAHVFPTPGVHGKSVYFSVLFNLEVS